MGCLFALASEMFSSSSSTMSGKKKNERGIFHEYNVWSIFVAVAVVVVVLSLIRV